MKEQLADVVRVLHTVLVLFMIAVPFWPNCHWTILSMHVVLAISLMFHWYIGEDACFLTIVECHLRGVQPTNSFMWSLVNPVYKIQDKDLRQLSHLAVPLLALVSVWKIHRQWPQVRVDLRMLMTQFFS